MDRAIELLRSSTTTGPLIQHGVTHSMAYTTLCFLMLFLFLQLLRTTEGLNTTNRTICPKHCLCNWDTVDCSYSNLTMLDEDSISVGTRLLNVSHNKLGNLFTENTTVINAAIDNAYNVSPTNEIRFSRYISDAIISINLDHNEISANVFDILVSFPLLKELYASHNEIADVIKTGSSVTCVLTTLDVSDNRISHITADLFNDCLYLQQLFLHHNQLKKLSNDSLFSVVHSSLENLSLSHNNIEHIASNFLQHFPNLKNIDLSFNNLHSIDSMFYSHCSNLKFLSLSGNPIQHLYDHAFKSCDQLTALELSKLRYVKYLSQDSLYGLDNITALNISHSSLQIIHPKAFMSKTLLQLDLSYNKLTVLYNSTFQVMNSCSEIILTGNPWDCNCDLLWLKNNTKYNSIDFLCSSPRNLSELVFSNLSSDDLVCTSPIIVNRTENTSSKIGTSVTLDCIIESSPQAEWKWIIPNKKEYKFHPMVVDYSLIEPGLISYHSDHHWHQAAIYFSSQEANHKRIHLLPNGSLYIDYVTRHDAGPYSCIAINSYGQATAKIYFTLDYQSLFVNTWWSMIFGAVTAVGMLLIGFGVGAIQMLVERCSKKEREKKRSIGQVLQNLNDYRSAKFDQISAFKSAKMDQFSAFKNAKVDKLRTYKQATVQSVLQQMQTLREHYTAQIDKVKDNCSLQVEKLRENYSFQAEKFKEYKITKVGILKERYKFERMDKLKDHYNNQALKIREYGAQQMTKLRDQYKLQHQHLLKLLELLDVGNCMSAIEAECMRTESMIFNENLMNLNIDTEPVNILLNLSDTDSMDSTCIVLSKAARSNTDPLSNLHQSNMTEQYSDQNAQNHNIDRVLKTKKKVRRKRKKLTPSNSNNCGLSSKANNCNELSDETKATPCECIRATIHDQPRTTSHPQILPPTINMIKEPCDTHHSLEQLAPIYSVQEDGRNNMIYCAPIYSVQDEVHNNNQIRDSQECDNHMIYSVPISRREDNGNKTKNVSPVYQLAKSASLNNITQVPKMDSSNIAQNLLSQSETYI